ncbi:MAG: (2Fe-2S)-binding protein [Deltaproteobacteria bacterium]|nr:(2Fe-2S)-binding protein [Deltaproteobacteria bacterium]
MKRPTKQPNRSSRKVITEIEEPRRINLTVNGEAMSLTFRSWRTLLEVLRDDLDLTGTKEGCDGGECGACTVLIDDEPRLACMTLAATLHGKKVLTIEGLLQNGNLHPLQRAFLEKGAVQCGYCTPGVILSAKSLLDRNPTPAEDDIKRALSGNLCRCTGYQKIIDAVMEAAEPKIVIA